MIRALRGGALAALLSLGVLACERQTADAKVIAGEQGGNFQKRFATYNGVRYPYQLFTPQGYDPSRAYPVFIYLHGGGDNGDDNEKQMRYGAARYVRDHAATFPAVGIFPQMSLERGGVGRAAFVSTVILALDATMRELHVDSSRVYMSGVSFGGIQGYEIVYRNPGRFAAWVPVSAHLCVSCVGGNAGAPQATYQAVAHAFSSLAFWQFQGAKDDVIPLPEVHAFYAVLHQANPAARYTEYPDGDHGIWQRVYSSPEFWEWLFAQRVTH